MGMSTFTQKTCAGGTDETEHQTNGAFTETDAFESSVDDVSEQKSGQTKPRGIKDFGEQYEL
jgi:hypothetical protein